MLKINGAIATNEEKAITAKELLGLTRKEMISITEPKNKASWSGYKNFLKEKFSMSSEFTGIQNEEPENKEDFESSTQKENQKDGAINLDISMEETEQDITVIEEETFKETATSTPKVSPIKMATLIKQCKIEGTEDHTSKKGKAVRSDLAPPSKSTHERVCKIKTSQQHEKLQK